MEDYKPNNISVTEVPSATRAGTVMKKQVTFYVGTHGPFTKQYLPDEYTVDKVKADIQTEVNALRALGDLTT